MTVAQDNYTLQIILEAVADERRKQDEKWGEQHHPDVLRPVDHRWYEDEANLWKQENRRRIEADTIAWDGILLEEVFEALAEEGHEKLRAELIQVSAVAVAWIEDIDSRTGDKYEGGK